MRAYLLKKGREMFAAEHAQLRQHRISLQKCSIRRRTFSFSFQDSLASRRYSECHE